ncbi:MAG TPA: lipoprotein [Bauldia sp.]|nr:lipoprotein [Bauldia sp.]
MRGVSVVALNDRRVILRAVLAAVVISAVGLSACGRKGPLEPPPKADVTSDNPDDTPNQAAKPNRSFPLDFLL